MDDMNVVSYWRQILVEVNRKKKINANLDFAANLIAYLGAFLPLRGWNLEDRTSKKHLDSLADFILRGLGITT
jgi:hypothetical protein